MADNLLTGSPETDNSQVQADVQEQKAEGGLLTGLDETPPKGEKALPETRPERPAWMGQLPKELQVDEGLTKFSTIGDLGKAYRELEGKFGKAIVIPDEKATPEEREAYYKKIGRPETPDGYDIKPPKMPKNAEMSKEALQECKAIAHKAGMTTPQTQAWIDGIAEMTKKAIADQQKQAEIQATQARETLAREWGDGFKEEVARMQKAFTTFGNPQIKELFDKAGISNNPDVCKMFAAIGKLVKEDKFVEGQRSTQSRSAAETLYPSK